MTVRAALELPAGFPRDAEAFALDLDGTLVGADKTLRPRPRDALLERRECRQEIRGEKCERAGPTSPRREQGNERPSLAPRAR